MIRTVLAASLLSLAALAAQPASAADHRTAAESTVTLKGVDFGRSDQAKFAYAKLLAAAKRVCDSEAYDPQTANDDRSCEQQAMSDALSTVNAPQLSMLAGDSTEQSDDADRYAVVAAAPSNGTR